MKFSKTTLQMKRLFSRTASAMRLKGFFLRRPDSLIPLEKSRARFSWKSNVCWKRQKHSTRVGAWLLVTEGTVYTSRPGGCEGEARVREELVRSSAMPRGHRPPSLSFKAEPSDKDLLPLDAEEPSSSNVGIGGCLEVLLFSFSPSNYPLGIFTGCSQNCMARK